MANDAYPLHQLGHQRLGFSLVTLTTMPLSLSHTRSPGSLGRTSPTITPP